MPSLLERGLNVSGSLAIFSRLADELDRRVFVNPDRWGEFSVIADSIREVVLYEMMDDE